LSDLGLARDEAGILRMRADLRGALRKLIKAKG